MSREVKVGNEWVRVAGRGKAEYGASHYQTGTVGNPEITNGKSSGFYKSLQVTFDETMPDTDYQVTLAMVGSYWAEVDVAVGTRTTTGFTLLFKYTHGTAEPATLTIAENSFQVRWQAFKLYSDKEYDELLDDVATLKTITSGTATVNTVNLYNSGTQVSNCSYRKCGKTVQVQFTAFFKTALTWSSTDMVLFSGLPKAVSTITPICYNLSKNTICDVQMNTSGNITAFDGINGTVAVNDRVTGSFCYIAAE